MNIRRMSRRIKTATLVAVIVASFALGLAYTGQRAFGWSAGVPQSGPSGGVHRELARIAISKLQEQGWKLDGNTIDASSPEWQRVIDGSVVPDAVHFLGVNWYLSVEQLEAMLDNEHLINTTTHLCTSLGGCSYQECRAREPLQCSFMEPCVTHECEDELCEALCADFDRLDAHHEASEATYWRNQAKQEVSENKLVQAQLHAGYAMHFAADWICPSHLGGQWDVQDAQCALYVPWPENKRHTLWEAVDESMLAKAGSLPGESCFNKNDLDARWNSYRTLMEAEWQNDTPSCSTIAYWGDGDAAHFDNRIKLALERSSMLARYIAADVFDLTPPAYCAEPPPSGANVDVALIIDSSGSMSWNDPPPGYPGCDADHPQNCPGECSSDYMAKRQAAARTYVSSASSNGDQVAVVDFDSDAFLASQLREIPGGNGDLIAAINTIDSCGTTDIGSGLQVACDELKRDTSGRKKGAILLTDGRQTVGSYLDQHDCFGQEGWPVYVFSLGSDIDTVLLQRIADDTGGQYTPLPTSNLICEFQRVRSLIAGVTPPPCQSTHVNPGQTVSYLASVPPGQSQATFSVSWPGSTVGVSLIPPSGSPRIECDSPPSGVTCDKGDTFVAYRVENPEAGDWTIELFGEDLPSGGEDAVIGVSYIPAPTPTPTATPMEYRRRSTATPEPTATAPAPTATPVATAVPPPLAPPAPVSEALPIVVMPATGDGGYADDGGAPWYWCLVLGVPAAGIGWFGMRRAATGRRTP